MSALGECLFVSDLHGRSARIRALAATIEARAPTAVFIGGDVLPAAGAFDADELAVRLRHARHALGERYPHLFLIPGNDDPKVEEATLVAAGGDGLWTYVHGRTVEWNGWRVFGYAYVPPTPFLLKDWERYDVSRYVDPGCVSPEEGYRTVPVEPSDARYGTIAADLEALVPPDPLDRTVGLFHAPPYNTALDRAALDDRVVDHAPVDVHVGSIAIRRFVERRQPAVTLHGHIHESARLTGRWLDTIGATVMLSAAHDGPELAVVVFDPGRPQFARRELLSGR